MAYVRGYFNGKVR